MNDSPNVAKVSNRTEQILQALSGTQDRRQKLIAIIGECVNRLHPIQERPQAGAKKEQRMGGLLSEVDSFIETISHDNDRLELIAETLQKII